MSNAYIDPWDMLNNFCFHVYAQMSLFVAVGENVNAFFWTAPPPASSREFANHRAGSQLKIKLGESEREGQLNFKENKYFGRL